MYRQLSIFEMTYTFIMALIITVSVLIPYTYYTTDYTVTAKDVRFDNGQINFYITITKLHYNKEIIVDNIRYSNYVVGDVYRE